MANARKVQVLLRQIIFVCRTTRGCVLLKNCMKTKPREQVWSSTPCTGGFMALKNARPSSAKCLHTSTRLGARCCADQPNKQLIPGTPLPCEILGWTVGRSNACGASKVRGVCPQSVIYTSAAAICQGAYARVCTAEELEAGMGPAHSHSMYCTPLSYMFART